MLDQRIAEATLLPDGRILAIGVTDDPGDPVTFLLGEPADGPEDGALDAHEVPVPSPAASSATPDDV